MNLFDFAARFPDESAAKLAWKSFRDRQGVSCKKCGGTDYLWLRNLWQYQCRGCKFRTTLRSGTVMEASNLPFRYWLMAIHLLTSTKKSFSALEMQRQLGHKRYEPIWAMLHKLRTCMGNRDDRYTLKGLVEVDDAFFEQVPQFGKNEDPKKRGRGSSKQAKVVVMASCEPVPEDKRGKHSKATKLKYVKMMVVDDLEAGTIAAVVESDIDPSSTVVSDAYAGNNRIKEKVARHISRVVPSDQAGKVLPWVHIAISNAKRQFLGVHHSIKEGYLQNYLNEFCYKLNRRHYTDVLFDRLIVAALDGSWYKSAG